MRVISDTKKPVKVWASILEQEAEDQVRKVAELPFIHSHVAVMPDAHAGRGSTVGTVIATRGAIIPAAVGVDIGCGMHAVRLPLTVEQLGGSEKLAALRHSIERSVPVGRNGNKEVTSDIVETFSKLGTNTVVERQSENGDFARVLRNAAHQLGSLGGGNHFIEVCVDLTDDVWIVVHSGSRNIGKSLAERHIEKAKDLMKQYFISLPDPDLAYLAQDTAEFKAYMQDLMWGQRYAKANREEMVRRVLEQVYRHVYGNDAWHQELESDKNPDRSLDKHSDGLLFHIDCHHNYTSIENFGGHNVFVTRKGAVSAREYQWGIIPGSMGTRSYIVQGLGNEDSFCSCSHGAGRQMSRTKAKARFTVEDLKNQTAGIECRKDADVVDEIPGAYKDIDQVMADQADLVKPVYELRQLICVKG